MAHRAAVLGHPALGAAVHRAATDAFVARAHVGCYVAGGVALVGMVLAVAFLPSQPPTAMFDAGGSDAVGVGTLDLVGAL